MNLSTVKLCEACDLITKGTTPTTLGYEFADSGVPFLRAQNLFDGRVDVERDPLFIPYDVHKALSRSQIRAGDILISIAGTIGRAALVDSRFPDLNCNQAVAIVRPTNRIWPPYLLHWIASDEAISQINQSKVTATISNLSLGEIGKLEIPLPLLDEQRRIAAILDQADALRRKRREAMGLLEKLRRSAFDNIFGDPSTNPKNWPVGRISDVTESTQYGTSSKAGEIGNFPILRMGNLTVNGGWKLHDMKFIEFAERDVDKYTVTKGDILFNRTNSPDLVGKTAVFREEKPFGFAGYLVRLRLNERAKPEYVAGYLNSSHGKATLRGMCKSIIGMANINAKELVSIPLMLPPIELQKSFSVIVEQSLKAEKSQSAHLEEMDVFFASLQHRAFRGEL